MTRTDTFVYRVFGGVLVLWFWLDPFLAGKNLDTTDIVGRAFVTGTRA